MNSPSSAPEARASALRGGLLQRLRGDRQGATAIEFAVAFPIVFMLTLALIDFMLLLLDHHRASEAARRAVREATILPPVVQLSSLTPGGSSICANSAGSVSCSSGSVQNAEVFADLIAAAQPIFPRLTAENLRVIYQDVGLGDPDLPGGILPQVSVELQNVEFKFTALGMLPGLPDKVTLPAFRSSMIAGGAAPE